MRKLLALFAILMMIASAAPVSAQDFSCGDSAPNRRQFKVVDDEGIVGGGPSSDTATFTFRPTMDEIEAMRRCGSGVVIDFRFTNYRIQPGETEVTFGGGNIGTYGSVTEDPNGNPIMRVEGIDPYELMPNRPYTVSVTFRMFYAVSPNTGIPHTLSLEWAPGEWFAEEYPGQCGDYLSDEADTGNGTYCHARYNDEATELEVYSFVGY